MLNGNYLKIGEYPFKYKKMNKTKCMRRNFN